MCVCVHECPCVHVCVWRRGPCEGLRARWSRQPSPPAIQPPLTSVGLPGPFGGPLSEAGVWRQPPCLPAWSSGSQRGPRVGERGRTQEESGRFTLHTAQSISSFLGRDAWDIPELRGRAHLRGCGDGRLPGGLPGVLEAPGAGEAHTGPPSEELASPDAQDSTLLSPCWPPPALRTRHPRCGGNGWVKSIFFSGCPPAIFCPELHTRCLESRGHQESAGVWRDGPRGVAPHGQWSGAGQRAAHCQVFWAVSSAWGSGAERETERCRRRRRGVGRRGESTPSSSVRKVTGVCSPEPLRRVECVGTGQSRSVWGGPVHREGGRPRRAQTQSRVTWPSVAGVRLGPEAPGPRQRPCPAPGSAGSGRRSRW